MVISSSWSKKDFEMVVCTNTKVNGGLDAEFELSVIIPY